MTDVPEEVTEEVTEAAPVEAPVEELAVEPQAHKPNLLHTIINNPMWLALLFLTAIVLTLIILA